MINILSLLMMFKAICKSHLIKIALAFSVLRLDMAMSAIVNFPTSAKMLRVCGIISLFVATLMAVEVRASVHYEVICVDSDNSARWLYTPGPEFKGAKDYFEFLINQKLMDNWELHGGLSVSSYVIRGSTGGGEIHFKYCQAVVKP